MRSEKSLTKDLVDVLQRELRGVVILKHADAYTSGIPDLSVTWGGTTVWIEVKYANPGLIDRGIQRRMTSRLAAAGRCIYVVYDERDQTLYIVPPEGIQEWRSKFVATGSLTTHHVVSDYIRSWIRYTKE